MRPFQSRSGQQKREISLLNEDQCYAVEQRATMQLVRRYQANFETFAILHSVGTNGEHGLPRTNADKRHAVLLLLNDAEWSAWSNKEIARRCCVNAATVDKYRAELGPSLPVSGSEKSPKTYITKHGTEATMRTENIGRSDGLRRYAAPSQPGGGTTRKKAPSKRSRKTQQFATIRNNSQQFLGAAAPKLAGKQLRRPGSLLKELKISL